ncbi:cobalamin biosynthesis protein [Metallosphaera tengchongensis]|uniref:Probable cobalamin biosynthesis protein CobD n=1 Tax=Metallosphaera tengchongensis TaxID=1532350 RepID=A0A6N0NV24_9CREN|nr:cobalamin biosynthesis protein [Metallosphaera tengchongensis]QKR00017.1 cobalamin biosynthesis protein [Metallosphaera tengchongensis]
MLPILFASLLLDLLFGEPPVQLHPVVYVGRLSALLIKPYKGRLYGVLLWLASVLPVLIPVTLIFWVNVPQYLFILKVILAVYFLKISFSIRMLYKIVRNSIPLREESRHIVQEIVRRDLSSVPLGYVSSASIESLFESTVDGITSPIFWFLVLGLPGALLQRFSNTLDSMVGYKTPELIREGYFSAKVDTLLNYVPARLTGLFMIVSGILLGLDFRKALKVLRETKMESPNARYPISIAAGLLNVRLEKKGAYVVGDGDLPSTEHVEKAIRLFELTLILYILFISICYYYLYGIGLLSHVYGILEFI